MRIDARGNRCTYTFDSDSRLTGTRYPDGTRVTMGYDNVGNRRFLGDATGRYTTVYDSLNRARAVTTPANLTITLAFDAAGRRRTLVEPSGGTFTYGYDLANRGTLVVNPQSERTSWTYDAASRATIQRLSNLIRVSMAYDAADRLVRLANITSMGTTITSFRDSWDGAGNRLHRVEQDGTLVTWTYDKTNQLTREHRNGANSYDTTYSYDSAGNRLVKLDNAVRTTYTCDAANQLSKYVDNTGTTTFTYDATGNQRTQIASAGGGTTTNTWDFENRLTKVALPSDTLNTFTYNGDGQRVQRQDSSGTLKEVWDGQKILLETNQNSVTQVIYSLSPNLYGDLISQRRSGVSRYFLFDPLGSTSRLTDGSQNVTDSYLFQGFGESLLAAQPTTNPWQFVGRLGYYLDADLLSNVARFRELCVRIGRWGSADPAGVFVGSNLYAYMHNSPLTLTDPLGLRTYVPPNSFPFFPYNGSNGVYPGYGWLQFPPATSSLAASCSVSCKGTANPKKTGTCVDYIMGAVPAGPPSWVAGVPGTWILCAETTRECCEWKCNCTGFTYFGLTNFIYWTCTTVIYTTSKQVWPTWPPPAGALPANPCA